MVGRHSRPNKTRQAAGWSVCRLCTVHCKHMCAAGLAESMHKLKVLHCLNCNVGRKLGQLMQTFSPGMETVAATGKHRQAVAPP